MTVEGDGLTPAVLVYVLPLEPIAQVRDQTLHTHHPTEGFPLETTGGGAAPACVALRRPRNIFLGQLHCLRIIIGCQVSGEEAGNKHVHKEFGKVPKSI